ncbi:MAG: hypothetical protein F4Y54_01805 [Dehalococcoidia bacterium]|nr:hypothetical protein [Dehalococcoidia bacterium]
MVTQDLNTRLRTLNRLHRIAGESREGSSGVTEEVEARAAATLEHVWDCSAAEDRTFRESTFVTITGDGAVQFEWESEVVAIEVVVEPEGGFTVYVHPEGDEPEERNTAEVADAIEAIERGWSGTRRAARGV